MSVGVEGLKVYYRTLRGDVKALDGVTFSIGDGEIMGVRHRQFAVEGVQFHPESILTEHGHAILKNFLR